MITALNFPVWDLHGLSSGLLIAVIAVIHVFVAQFAVGGGFFLVMAEARGHREGSAAILKWVHRHTRFFLLLTMVFGGLTGVGLWLVISLVAPGGTAMLVREFVFVWAAEWVFFLGEILALLLYAASFARCLKGQMPPRAHMALGWVYALFAFLSLFVINAIISFMLTPGDWPLTRSFWDAFFNPGFWPSLTFRFGLCLSLAGIFGLITAIRIADEEIREQLLRFCAQWICLPFVLMVLGIIWYGAALPPELRELMQRRSDDIRPFVRAFLDAAPVLFLAGMFLFIKLPKKVYPPYAAMVLLLGLALAGSFEWVRETARRPWLVYGCLYSNGISPADGALINEKGVFASSGWARLAAAHSPDAFIHNASAPDADAPCPLPTDEAARERLGRFLYVQQCSTCHGLGAPRLDLLPRLRGRGDQGIEALLTAQGSISPYMPPFFGSKEEKRILARWLADRERTGGLLGQELDGGLAAPEPEREPDGKRTYGPSEPGREADR